MSKIVAVMFSVQCLIRQHRHGFVRNPDSNPNERQPCGPIVSLFKKTVRQEALGRSSANHSLDFLSKLAVTAAGDRSDAL